MSSSTQITITGNGPADIAALQRRLYEVAQGTSDRSLNGALRKRLREQMAPAKAELQAAVLALPSTGGSGGAAHRARGGKSGRSTGLRQRVAQLVQVKATSSGRNPGVRLRVDASRMPDGQKSLPELLEGVRPWRHPTYGHNPWVSQASHPYFRPTVARGRDRWRNAVLAGMRDVANFVNHR